MPVLDCHSIAFVHIPKTGGTAVDAALQRLGPLRLLEKSGSHVSWRRYGHSPQHCTYRELEELGELHAARRAPGGCIFAIVRHPFERVVSAFNMRRRSGAIKDLTFAAFLDQFLRLDSAAIRRFDAHQLPCMEYLRGSDGALPSDLHVLKYRANGQLAGVAGLLFPAQPELAKRFLTGKEFHQPGANAMSVGALRPGQRRRIAAFYAADALWYPDLGVTTTTPPRPVAPRRPAAKKTVRRAQLVGSRKPAQKQVILRRR